MVVELHVSPSLHCASNRLSSTIEHNLRIMHTSLWARSRSAQHPTTTRSTDRRPHPPQAHKRSPEASARSKCSPRPALPISITDLSEALGIHRSNTYRLLRTLEEHRFAIRDDAGLIRLGPRIASLAHGVAPAAHDRGGARSHRARARPRYDGIPHRARRWRHSHTRVSRTGKRRCEHCPQPRRAPPPVTAARLATPSNPCSHQLNGRQRAERWPRAPQLSRKHTRIRAQRERSHRRSDLTRCATAHSRRTACRDRNRPLPRARRAFRGLRDDCSAPLARSSQTTVSAVRYTTNCPPGLPG